MLHATSDSTFFGITHQAPALALQSHKLGRGLLEHKRDAANSIKTVRTI